ncbi:hypothetical protein CRE_28792 [Caenorhabditis remanei]|uniref:Uncharacterized protein n=1 Tax=Caenorhabditis remanei TaxID=31234 RepID=E3MK36_CAERE|nr:hypothetical protein CRE_28792 [Caenorhabditis remanei]
MSFSIRSCIVLFLFFKYSYTLECSTQQVDFNATNTNFTIQSDKTDLATKKCTYTFTVPKYFKPTVRTLGISLTGNNKIWLNQQSDFGGLQSYPITADDIYYLGPTSFTIVIDLPKKTADDMFFIWISVKDSTPKNITTFSVKADVGTLIDSGSLQGNSIIRQIIDSQSQASSYIMKITLFGNDVVLFNLLDVMYVYDGESYKGSLLNVFTASNSSIICSGSNFSIVNTNPTSVGIFTVLVSGKDEWNASKVSLSSAPNVNVTQVFSATDGLTVFKEITNPFNGPGPVMYNKITFRGDGELSVYAGCVPGAQDNKKVAVITPSNAANYENLMISGRCKTYVLTKGVVQWESSNLFIQSYRHQIGQKGVIMSKTYPYPNTGDQYSTNYLIQSPSASSKENIIVTYEVALMSPDVSFNIDQDIKAYQDVNKTLSSSDKTYTSVSTYQQYMWYTVPKNSDGFLIRYTVTSSASSIGHLFVLCILSFFYLH